MTLVTNACASFFTVVCDGNFNDDWVAITIGEVDDDLTNKRQLGALKVDWINLDVVHLVSRTVCALRVTTLYSFEICEVLISFANAFSDAPHFSAVSGVVVVSWLIFASDVGFGLLSEEGEFFGSAEFVTVGAVCLDLSPFDNIGLINSPGKFSRN